MTSESGWGPVAPSPVTSTDGDHIRPGPPAVTQPAPQPAPAATPAGASPLEPTGDERVDEAVARLGELGGAPVARHVEIFEDVHRRLQNVLTDIDQAAPAQSDHVHAAPAHAALAHAAPAQAGQAPGGTPVPRPPGLPRPGGPPPTGEPGGN